MSAYNLNEVVRLRRNDQKDKELSEKITKIVKYAIQEVSKFETYRAQLVEGGKKINDVVKDAEFKSQLMLAVEG